MLCWVGDANATTTVYSGTCYSRSGAPGNGYLVVDYFTTTPYNGPTDLPSITTVYPVCTNGTRYYIYPSPSGNLNTSEFDVFGSFGVIYSCTACADGYELALAPGPYVYGISDMVSCTSFTNINNIQTCVPKASGGTTCTSSNCVSSDWVTYNDAYITRTARSCTDSTTCTETIQYGCNYGYYKTSGSSAYLTSASGCSKCPSYVVNGTSYTTTTAIRDADTVQSCVVDAVGGVTEFQDASGTFVMAAPYGMEATPPNYCTFSLGNCAGYTAVCSTTSGTSYSVLTGTMANSTSGTYCWCNANGKRFMVANMGSYSTCAPSCKSACLTALTGFEANGWSPMVSLTDLGC